MTQHTQPGGKVKEREWVLGDADVATLWREFLVTATLWPHNASNTPWDFARSVEAAVLAKVRAERDFLPRTEREAQAAYLNAKWEREARKRERHAYAYGYLDAAAYLPFYDDSKMTRGRDERFPLPTKRVPRTVVLSDGRKVRAGGIGWQYTLNVGQEWGESNMCFGLARTPADARLLADLVERPYDEVPDGEG